MRERERAAAARALPRPAASSGAAGNPAPPPPRRASALYRDIWAAVQRIPRGRVATYGQIARVAGHPGQPRIVGYALHSLPEEALRVPWHRVINAHGMISRRACSAWGEGESLQRALLEQEGVFFDSHGRLDLTEYQWRPRESRPTLSQKRRTGVAT